MTRRDPDRPAPIWLSDHWERKKTETVRRVRTAIELLVAEHHAVTISAIRNKVTTVFGVPFSANTIKRNEAAYALYLSSRQPPRNRSARDVLLRDLYVHASDTEKTTAPGQGGTSAAPIKGQSYRPTGRARACGYGSHGSGESASRRDHPKHLAGRRQSPAG